VATNERLADEALKHLGKPYVWATAGPDTFDCSGLVYWCFERVTGEDLDQGYRDSHLQYRWGEAVRGEPERGDLVFFDTARGGEVRLGNAASHVGIALGGGRFVHAANPSVGVIVSDLAHYRGQYPWLGARRLLPAGGRGAGGGGRGVCRPPSAGHRPTRRADPGAQHLERRPLRGRLVAAAGGRAGRGRRRAGVRARPRRPHARGRDRDAGAARAGRGGDRAGRRLRRRPERRRDADQAPGARLAAAGGGRLGARGEPAPGGEDAGGPDRGARRGRGRADRGVVPRPGPERDDAAAVPRDVPAAGRGARRVAPRGAGGRGRCRWRR